MSSLDPEEGRLGDLLAQAGRRPQPPEAKRQEWETLFRGELDRVVKARRKQRRTSYGAVAALMLVAAGVFLLARPAEQQAIVVAKVVNAIDGNQTFRNGDKLVPLTAGSNVHVDQTVRTTSKGMLALAYRNADVRLNADTTVLFHTASIELIDGGIYIDTGSSDREQGAPPVIVTTALGSFSHTGTQFMVMVDAAREVTAAVREGTIHLRTENVQQDFNATKAGAEMVKISQSGAIETGIAARHGELWEWVVSSSPGKKINGLPAHEVLTWIARESGSTLRYESPQIAADAADNSIIAPDEPMNPRRALKLLNRVTSLRADDSSGVDLLVSGSEGDQYPD